MAIRQGTCIAGLAVALTLLIVGAITAAAAEDAVVLVPRVTIYPGDVITEELLVDKPVASLRQAPGSFLGRDGLIGKVSRQTLLPGQPVPPNAVREPFLIKQGQAALVIFEVDELIISANAVSLQSGAAGDLISLRNVDSGSTIRGVVQGDGTVRVGAP